MTKNKFKTFPLTVEQSWLDQLDKYKKEHESKHDFVLRAVANEIQNRKEGIEIIREGEK